MKAYPILPSKPGGSAYAYPDPEGAPGLDGVRRHGALDWFSPGGTIVRSPVNGAVIEARATRGNHGQVFGGTLKVREDATNRVWVMRHVDSQSVSVGQKVRAGQAVCRVTRWADNPSSSHVHLEIWRTLAGGYRLPNMIDPATVTWTLAAGAHLGVDLGALDKRTYIRVDITNLLGVRRTYTGWGKCAGVLRSITKNGLKTDRCAIAFQGPKAARPAVWRGRTKVRNVARSLTHTYLGDK